MDKDSAAEAAVAINSCITVLQGDLTQPGTPAIVLKLAASWEKLKLYFQSLPQGAGGILQLPVEQEGEEQEEHEIVGEGVGTECTGDAIQASTAAVDTIGREIEPVATQLTANSEGDRQEFASESHETESPAAPGALEEQGAGVHDNNLGDDYQRVELPVLYYHSKTGYYYDPSTQQFLAPSSYYQGVQGGEGGGAESSADTSQQVSQQDHYTNHAASLEQQVELHQPTETSVPSQTSHSIADMLAAASDRVVERLGYEYSEAMDMYYCGSSGLYYDQETKLYYDPDLGCYYEYDYETKKYSFHSRVSLPEAPKEKKRKRSSSPEFFDSPEEGELRLPHIPRGSPPPEEDWAPCIRAIVSGSEKLKKGTLFIVTQDGANFGREPTASGRELCITVPELNVSKLHAIISYDKHEKSFMVQDLGSVNGTFLNKDQRLSEARESSQPCPLVHGHTLTMGSTTFSLHIHNGWENCMWCDPSRGLFQSEDGVKEVELPEEELDLQRRKELNRIKKKYGLRVKDTFNEEVKLQEGYSDRSETRRKTVGSDVPDLPDRPTSSSSVHSAISEGNKGRTMLQKLGWKEGQGLGKGQQGITEPVKHDIRAPKVGLGSGVTSRSLDSAGDTNSTSRKAQLVQKRFEEAVQLEKVKRKRLDN